MILGKKHEHMGEGGLSRPHHFKFFKGCLPQISLGPFWNTLSHMWVKIANDIISESNDIRVLGITTNSDVKLEKSLPEVCKKANRKSCVLPRLVRYLTFKKRKMISKALSSLTLNIVP